MPRLHKYVCTDSLGFTMAFAPRIVIRQSYHTPTPFCTWKKERIPSRQLLGSEIVLHQTRKQVAEVGGNCGSNFSLLWYLKFPLTKWILLRCTLRFGMPQTFSSKNNAGGFRYYGVVESHTRRGEKVHEAKTEAKRRKWEKVAVTMRKSEGLKMYSLLSKLECAVSIPTTKCQEIKLSGKLSEP